MQTRSGLRRQAMIPPPPSLCNAFFSPYNYNSALRKSMEQFDVDLFQTISDTFDVGTFYEIDHSKLPQKSPVKLRTLRLVKVSGRTKLKTNVKFPSLVLLRNYFSAKPAGADCIPGPELDKELAMSYDCVRTKRNVFVEANSEERVIALPRDTRWRRRSWPVVKEKVDVDRTLIGKKRTRGACRKGKGKEKKKRNVNVEASSEERSIPRKKGSTGRWSKNRYRSAELKLLETIREKGAEIGRPIMRQELREEARKHVGDTGLLDHLLKNIDGKVVARGAERIRRRHNMEGTLEYWLEPAELMEIREMAGVEDPYWVPPSVTVSSLVCASVAECKKETSRLREEMAILEREKEQLEKERADVQTALAAAAHSHGACCRDWQVKHYKLVEWNARMEAEMGAFNSCVEGLKEQLKILKEKEMGY